MNNKELLITINNKLSIVQEVIKNAIDEKKISNIDIDYSLLKIIDLYDNLLVLRKNYNDTFYKNQEPQNVSSSEVIEDSQTKLVQNQSPQKIYKDVVVQSVKIADLQGTVVEKAFVNPVVKVDVKPEENKIPKSKILSEENYKEVKHKKHIKIAINDKFEFIRELFGSSKNKYESTLRNITDIGEYSGIMSYLDSDFSWDSRNDVVKKFYSIIKQNF